MTSTKVKICGLSDELTMAAALDGGADYVGLVFYGPSPRNIDLDTARLLAGMARGRARIVALTVDAEDELLSTLVKEISPDVLQLHGSESPSRVSGIMKAFCRPVMKAIKVRTATDAELALQYSSVGALILFDAKPQIIQAANSSLLQNNEGSQTARPLPGGNGETFDWSALDEVKNRVAFMLSGGLNPDNIEQAIEATGAQAVDVSSGVETTPGTKDTILIRQFIAKVKSARVSAHAPGKHRFDES